MKSIYCWKNAKMKDLKKHRLIDYRARSKGVYLSSRINWTGGSKT